MAEVDLDGGPIGEFAMSGELEALVRGERFTQRGWDPMHSAGKGLADCGGVAPLRHWDEDGETSRPLDQGSHSSLALSSP